MRRTRPSLNNPAGHEPTAAACILAALLALTASVAACHSSTVPLDDGPKVTGVPEAVVERFKLDTTFYKKHLDYKGFSILGSAKVSDAALLEAQYLIDRLLCDRDDILKLQSLNCLRSSRAICKVNRG